MKLADKYRTIGVRTNADTPHDAEVAVRFGAEGIGLYPHRAHVLRGRAHHPDARDDPGRNRRGAREGPGQTAALAARGLHRHLQGVGGPARDHPLPRSAAARVRPARRRRTAGDGRRHGRVRRDDQGQGRKPPRVQPDAGPSRLPPGDRLPRDHGHAGPRGVGSRLRRQGLRTGNHDPAGGQREGTGQPEEDRPGGAREGQGREEAQEAALRVQNRHDDRGAAARSRPTRSPSRRSSSASAPTT